MRRHTLAPAGAALALVLLVAAPARAGRVNVPCDAPGVFPGAAVNVIVLPYSAPPELRASADVGRALARLVQVETLLSIAQYGSVGATQLVEAGVPCDPEAVFAAVTGRTRGRGEPIRPGHGVVLVWGRIYRDGDDIYLQTFVRFGRRDAPDLGVRIGGETFGARTTHQAFACVPRKLSYAQLRSIDEQFRRADVLYAAPDAGARRVAMPTDVPFSYYVTQLQGDWMRVETSGSGPSGWLLARSGAGDGLRLSAVMPELWFVDGVVGYLRALASSGPDGVTTARRAFERAGRSLAEYQKAWRAGALVAEGGSAGGAAGFQPLAVGIPLQIRGLMALAASDLSLATLGEVRGWFARAAALVPYSADARNLEVLARLALAYIARDPGTDPRAALVDLQEALAAEPDNALVALNVARACRLLLGPPERQPPALAPLSVPEREALQRMADGLARVAAR